MQTGDEVIGLPGSFRQVFDLVVFDADLPAQKFVLAFEAPDILCRDRSGSIGSSGRSSEWRSFGASVVAARRERSHLFDVRDVLRDRGFGDQILLSELRFDPATTEMTFGAISLNASGCSRMAGVFVPGGGFSERRTMKT